MPHPNSHLQVAIRVYLTIERNVLALAGSARDVMASLASLCRSCGDIPLSRVLSATTGGDPLCLRLRVHDSPPLKPD
ncbi:MAG: hypothetical protein OWT27_05395 [Firmicutes bacterium]|nr:hypothetical protein [Bacillota bacterium]